MNSQNFAEVKHAIEKKQIQLKVLIKAFLQSEPEFHRNSINCIQ